MMDDSPFGHIHCRACGREMRPGSLICPRCDAIVLGKTGQPSAVAVATPVTAPAAVDSTTPLGGAPRSARLPSPAPVASVLPPAEFLLGRPIPPPEEYVLEPEPAAAAVAVAPAPVTARPTAVPAVPSARTAPIARRKFRPIDIWKRYLPPVRLVWIFLGILIAVGGGFVSGARAYPLIAIPIVGVIVDLAFQKVRFPRFRFPDAALATSLFLSLIIWPADVSLALISIATVSVGLRHFVRAGGHPWFNPAAAGLILATAIFALPTSWHVGLGTGEIALVALMGVILMIRAPHAWRIPVFYFASNLIVVLALTFALGAGARWPMAIEFEVLSGASVFFGFFMVTEPRTAPSARWAMALYGIIVGVVSGAFPVLFTEVDVLGALGVIAPFLALLVGNLVTLVLPSARGSHRSAPAPIAATPG